VTPEDVAAQKRALRREMRARRLALTDGERTAHSARIAHHLLALEVWNRAQAVFAYLSTPDEVQTDALIAAALDSSKRVCVPRMEPDGSMSAVHLPSLERIAKSALFREPPAGGVIAAESVDLTLLPCVAVDRAGNRLGRGGGHCDRFIAQTRHDCVNLGLVFGCQVAETLPLEPHDRRLSGWISEAGIVWAAP
jgi:5-formyltetrahydrofolate cyclo-ligase